MGPILWQFQRQAPARAGIYAVRFIAGRDVRLGSDYFNGRLWESGERVCSFAGPFDFHSDAVSWANANNPARGVSYA